MEGMKQEKKVEDNVGYYQQLADLTVSAGQSPADWSDDLNDCLLLEQAEQAELLKDEPAGQDYE